MTHRPLRWALLGTANIATRSFLPAMRAAGGIAAVVGSRDPQAALPWAHQHQVGRTAGYAEAIEAADVDAIYIALPNDLHVHWAARAAATGRAVLCEKPLGLDGSQTAQLLAEVGDALLWEAFVFPFHPQSALLAQLCAPSGPIGGLAEIVGDFHVLTDPADRTRWSPEHGGGALLDLGCYPVRLARLLFAAEPTSCAAHAVPSGSGVDAEFAGIASFPGTRRLCFSVGFRRAGSTFARLIGPDGEVRVSNPYHPVGGQDDVQLWRSGQLVERWPVGADSAFQCAIRHIGEVVGGVATPRHLAATDAAGNARALDLLRAAAKS